MTPDDTVLRVRAAMKDRALYLALLLRSYSSAMPKDQAVELARHAIFELGQIKGRADPQAMTPEQWVDRHVAKGSAAVFESQIVKAEDRCEQIMTFCPLVEAWRELGCSVGEVDLLCDVAMAVDRGRAAYHGIRMELRERIGKGDAMCRLVLFRDG